MYTPFHVLNWLFFIFFCEMSVQVLWPFYFIFSYLFLAAWGLRCCAWAFSSCGERALLFIVVHGLLMAVASLVAEHRL